jgi:hypothetical protein
MTWLTTRVIIIVGLMLSVITSESILSSAYAYRCGQSRPCPGGYNPYNPDSYNHVAEHGYNSFGSIGGVSGPASTFTKIAHPGQVVIVRTLYSMNPDCASRGHYEIKLLSPPRGGSVSLQSALGYPDFPQSNVRWACDRKKSPVDQVVYRVSSDFSGEDGFDLEAISPDHNAYRFHSTVMVE